MFTLAMEANRALIRAHFTGFFTTEHVAEFARQEQAMVVAIGCGSGEYLLLVDTSQCNLQSQDVVAAFQQIIQSVRFKARRIAVIAGGSLSRMQTRRILLRDQAALFETRGEAERWLFATQGASAAG